jgi:hypothetical protein
MVTRDCVGCGSSCFVVETFVTADSAVASSILSACSVSDSSCSLLTVTVVSRLFWLFVFLNWLFEYKCNYTYARKDFSKIARAGDLNEQSVYARRVPRGSCRGDEWALFPTELPARPSGRYAGPDGAWVNSQVL